MNISLSAQNNLVKQIPSMTDLSKSKNTSNTENNTLTNAPPLSLTQAVGGATGATGPASLTEAMKNLVGTNPIEAFTQTAVMTMAQMKAPDTDALTNRQIDDIISSVGLEETAERMEPLFDGIADKIINRILQNKDHDNNSVLTQQELKMSDERFQQIDRNEDGLISVGELTSALTRDLGRAARFDPNLNIEAFAEEWFNAIDLANSGTLSGKEVPQPMPSRERMDENGDGTLSLTEAKPDSHNRMSTIDKRNALVDVANNIGKRLDEAGFTHKPPVNIRTLIDSLRLDFSSKGSLMQMLSARYPHGLGISLFG